MEADDNMSLRVASFSCYLDTAKESLVRRVSAQDHTQLPPTLKPPINIKFSKKDHSLQDHGGGLTNLRVDSFNSFLNPAADRNFVFEVSGPIQDPTSAFTFSHEIPKEGEIGVFGADKYFNMKLEYQTGNKTACKNEAVPANLAPMGRNIMPRTPSLNSETTSWNSQRALLQNLQRNESHMKQKKAMARRFFMGFGCRGPCFDKKSVHIDESVAQEVFYTPKPTRTGSERLDHHLALAPPPPPNLGGNHQDLAAEAAKKMMKIEDLDESRHSIEVFGSLNRSAKGDAVATNMERKLSMLTWDAIPKGRSLPTSRDGTSTLCDDMASEASSDLFEIENISGSIFPLLAADDNDMSSCMSPTTSHYAPSEASIQWSVVTASAADYSALSEFNDESVSVTGDAVSKKIVAKRGKEVQKVTKAGGFLGCKSQKAVDVAEMKGKTIIQGQLQ